MWNGIRTRDIIHFSMYHHYINCYFPCLSTTGERDGTSQTHWRHGLQLSDQTKHRARLSMWRLIRCHCLCPHPPTRSSSLWAHKNNTIWSADQILHCVPRCNVLSAYLVTSIKQHWSNHWSRYSISMTCWLPPSLVTPSPEFHNLPCEYFPAGSMASSKQSVGW